MSEPTPQPTTPVDKPNEALKSLVGMLRFLFAGLRLLIVVVFVCLLFGGIFYVEEYERAMLFRFGKLVTREGKPNTFTSGWFWGWPSPIDHVRKIPAGRSITVTTDQFWNEGSAGGMTVGEESTPEMETLQPGEDGYLVTGDANIMHMVWSCTYRIDDPERYYLGLYAPEDEKSAGAPRGVREILRSVLSNAVLTEVARWPVESVYRLGRRDSAAVEGRTLDKAVWQRFEEQVEKLDLGIEVQHIGATQVTPPNATLAAFREVADAANEYQTALDEAHAYQERQLARARGQEAGILAEARAYRERVVKTVKADVDAFQAFRSEYDRAPQATLLAFYLDTLRDVLEQVDNKYVLHPRADGKQEVRLLLSPKPKVPRSVREPGPIGETGMPR